MSSLIQIHIDYLEIINQIEANNGEISEELENSLITNLIQSKEKVSNYCLVLDKYESEIAFMKNKVKEAVAFIDRIESQKNKLERIALDVVNANGDKLDGVGGNWINKRKSTKLNVFDAELIPSIYTKIEVKLDNAKIKQDLLGGESVPGAKLEENVNLSWK